MIDKKNYKTEDLYPAMLDFAKQGCFYSIITDSPLWNECVRQFHSNYNCLLAKQGRVTSWWVDDVWYPSLEHNLYMGNCFHTKQEVYSLINQIREFAKPFAVKNPDEIKMGHRLEANFQSYMTVYLHSDNKGNEYFTSEKVHTSDYFNHLCYIEPFEDYKIAVLLCSKEGLLFENKEDADKVVAFAQNLLVNNSNDFFSLSDANRQQYYYNAFKDLSEDTDEEKSILPLSIVAKDDKTCIRRIISYIYKHYKDPNDYRLQQWFKISFENDIFVEEQRTINIDVLPWLEEYEIDGFTLSYTISEKNFNEMRKSVMIYKDNHECFPYDQNEILETLGEAYDTIISEIDDLLEKEEENYIYKLSKDINKINIWDSSEWTPSDEWFEKTVLEIIGYKYSNTDNIELDDLMSDLEEYIYPDEQDYEDPEEYEEKVEQLELYNEQDQHQIITAKAARHTARHILQVREELLKTIHDFIEAPAFLYPQDAESIVEQCIERTIK